MHKLTLIGPFLRTPTPNSDKPPTLSSNDILVAGSTMAAAAPDTAVGKIAAAIANSLMNVERDIVIGTLLMTIE